MSAGPFMWQHAAQGQTRAAKLSRSFVELSGRLFARRQLTALQSLTCHENYPRSINNLLPGLSGEAL